MPPSINNRPAAKVNWSAAIGVLLTVVGLASGGLIAWGRAENANAETRAKVDANEADSRAINAEQNAALKELREQLSVMRENNAAFKEKLDGVATNVANVKADVSDVRADVKQLLRNQASR